MRSVPGHTKYVAMSVLLGLFSVSALAEGIDAAVDAFFNDYLGWLA